MKVRYQLLRPSVLGDYKDPEVGPKFKQVGIDEKTGYPKKLQDFDIICKDYPLAMPIILFNQSVAHDVIMGQPTLVYKGDLYAIHTFCQAKTPGTSLGEIVVNIFVIYAGDPEISTITKLE